MQTLVVLNYNNSTVHTYKVLPSITIDDNYVFNVLGFKESECSWMCGTIEVIKHPGVITKI